MPDTSRGTITTNDNVTIAYEESGAGRPVLLVHGWQQSGELWKRQREGLSHLARMISIDQRGHGKSGKPDHGYMVHRLAADLAALVSELDLRDIVLVGHSMGCQVVLAYLQLFGADRVGKLVLVDEPILLTKDPSWSDEILAETGAVFDQDAVLGTVNGLADPASNEAVVRGLIDVLTTPGIAADDKEWIVQQNLLTNGANSAALFYNHAHQDWRALLPQVSVPTLVIGAEGSIVPVSCLQWAAGRIPNARIEVFGADEGGSHFMFIENPTKFNALLEEFIK